MIHLKSELQKVQDKIMKLTEKEVSFLTCQTPLILKETAIPCVRVIRQAIRKHLVEVVQRPKRQLPNSKRHRDPQQKEKQ